MRASRFPCNDLRQYDELVAEWWEPYGALAMLRWLAAARAVQIPAAPGPGALLVDIGCGGGLLAPHARRLGYRHVGIDLSTSGLGVARRHGVLPVRGDATRLPLPDGVADAVSAGEILEHVVDTAAVVAEACRVLRPGGRLVIDTLADTRLARLLAVTIAERVPGGAPPGIHDPALFVNRAELRAAAARGGVPLTLRGLRPSLSGMLWWLARREPEVRMVPTWSTAVLFQAFGDKVGGRAGAEPAGRVDGKVTRYAVRPDGGGPNASGPNSGGSAAPGSGGAESDVTWSGAAKPNDATGPNATGPDGGAPAAAGSDITGSDVTGFGATGAAARRGGGAGTQAGG